MRVRWSRFWMRPIRITIAARSCCSSAASRALSRSACSSRWSTCSARGPARYQPYWPEFDSGGFELLDLPVPWLMRAGELVDRYRDLALGLVDATVLAATEMLSESKLATLDRRHFSIVRPGHTESLTLLP